MSPVLTKFASQSNGFNFINRFEYQFPVKFQLPFVGQIHLSDVVYGLCGGMSFSALDYFYAGKPVPTYDRVDQISNKLFSYLCDRQLDSLKISVLIKVIQWMVSEDRNIGQWMTRYEIPKLRRALDKGNPVVLALIRVKGLGDPTHNHQVVATGYDYNPTSNVITIYLYEPNYPGQEPTLTVNLNNPSQGLQMSQSTGDFLRGFFLIDYTPQLKVPEVTEMPSFAAGIAFAPPAIPLRWPVDSSRVNQRFGMNPATYKPFGLPGHEGVDLYAPDGANIYACADGTVYMSSAPKDHPYGLQIRIKHQANGTTYHTVYAHLKRTLVVKDQTVTAGDLIGYADDTGNSFGSHLHLTLKIEGEQTPGYPASFVDPMLYLQPATEESPNAPGSIPTPLPPQSGVVVYTASQLSLHVRPDVSSTVRGFVPAGEVINVLGDAEQIRVVIGNKDAWLLVQTAGGLPGYVGAGLVQTIEEAFPPSDLVLYPDDRLNLRSGPATAYNVLATLSFSDPLTVLGDANNAQAKIGKQGEWLQVQTEKGVRGFVAAWLVHATGQPLPLSDLVLFPLNTLNVRARPAIDANILTVVTTSDALTVLGDKVLARTRIGQKDQWIDVSTPQGHRGFVAAWLVREGQGIPPASTPGTAQLTVYATDQLNVRAQASTNSPRIASAARNEALQVIEADLSAAQARIGKQAEWLHVQTRDGTRGWVAAWYVNAAPVV